MAEEKTKAAFTWAARKIGGRRRAVGGSVRKSRAFGLCEDDPVIRDPEKTVGKLLKALQAVDPSWNLCSVEVNQIAGYGFGPKEKVWGLSQGTRTFCRGHDFPGLLLDFVEACRDGWYSAGKGWMIPGALRDAADPDDLAFRLEVLT